MWDIKELPRYPNLSKLALACVVLPNSNADSKPIFTMLKKIQTEHRSISPQKVPTSEKLTEHNVQNEDSLPR
jgi:hypothetical protein